MAVHEIPFECSRCDVHSFTLRTAELTEELQQRTIDRWRRLHWCHEHRACAICGQQVRGGDLAGAINDGSIQIHENYTNDESFRKVPVGDIGYLLMVHKRCVWK